MESAPDQRDGSMSLRLRRVVYPATAAGLRCGVVTEHEQDRGMVTVLDTGDGTFWRGRADSIQVLV
jgi:hypothetical protein